MGCQGECRGGRPADGIPAAPMGMRCEARGAGRRLWAALLARWQVRGSGGASRRLGPRPSAWRRGSGWGAGRGWLVPGREAMARRPQGPSPHSVEDQSPRWWQSALAGPALIPHAAQAPTWIPCRPAHPARRRSRRERSLPPAARSGQGRGAAPHRPRPAVPCGPRLPSPGWPLDPTRLPAAPPRRAQRSARLAVALHLQAHPLAVPGVAAKGRACPTVALPPRR